MPTARALLSESLRFCRQHAISVLCVVLVIYIPLLSKTARFDGDAPHE
jgi:hypothetical protein